jgi:hypothetical protein
MTAKRVAAAHKRPPAIVAAVKRFLGPAGFRRAQELVDAINQDQPGIKVDVEDVISWAILTGLTSLERDWKSARKAI